MSHVFSQQYAFMMRFKSNMLFQDFCSRKCWNENKQKRCFKQYLVFFKLDM